MRILSQSVEARYFEQLGKKFLFPEDGYQGTYIKNIAQSVIDKHGNKLKKDDSRFLSEAEH